MQVNKRENNIEIHTKITFDKALSLIELTRTFHTIDWTLLALIDGYMLTIWYK